MTKALLLCAAIKKTGFLAVEVVINQHKENNIKIINDYDVDNVSTKVVRIILSYTEYINERIWRK